jgi:superfamily II DNA helicase RecQ
MARTKAKATSARSRHRKKKTRRTKTKSSTAPKTPPKPPQPSGDKCAPSPNSRAKCVACKRVIQQGQVRIGKEMFYEIGSRYFYRYYHQACFEQEKGLSIELKDNRTIEQELKVHAQRLEDNERLLQERSPLRVSLEQLRAQFATELHTHPSRIFPEITLNELVLYMPATKDECLKVNGIKEKRFNNFGQAILRLIRQYKQTTGYKGNSTPAAVTAAAIKRDGTTLSEFITADDFLDVDDDSCRVLEILTCEQIVRRKFEHARANNYVVSID